MIRHLRLRLTLLVISALILVTAGIVLSIWSINLYRINRKAQAALQILSDNRGQRPAPEGQGDGSSVMGDDRAEGKNAEQNDFANPGQQDPSPPPKPEGEASLSEASSARETVLRTVSSEMGPAGPQTGGPRSGSEGVIGGNPPGFDFPGDNLMASLSNSYTIRLDGAGAVTDWSSDRADLYTDAQIQAIADAILADGRDSGRVDTQYYRLMDDGASGGRLLIALDARLEFIAARQMIQTTILVAALACVLLSLGAYLLIQRMLRPVQESFERQKQFVWDASHEFKTPLAVISANAEVLSREFGPNEHLGYIQSEVQRTDGLVQNLLTLARMDKGTVAAEMKRFDLSEALLSVALPFESTVFEAGRTLETEVPEGVWIRGDAALIQQLTVILLSNALKYSDEGGLIRLSLAQKGHGAVITVYNTGIGIAPENLEKVFNRFYREDASHNREIAGNGLGLSIAQTIVQAHKGRIRAESTYGKDAAFIVTLPG